MKKGVDKSQPLCYTIDTVKERRNEKMTDFEVVKKMIKKIEDRDIEIDCLGAFQTITIDYVVLEFEDEKLIDIWKY